MVKLKAVLYLHPKNVHFIWGVTLLKPSVNEEMTVAVDDKVHWSFELKSTFLSYQAENFSRCCRKIGKKCTANNGIIFFSFIHQWVRRLTRSESVKEYISRNGFMSSWRKTNNPDISPTNRWRIFKCQDPDPEHGTTAEATRFQPVGKNEDTVTQPVN